jgi:hypothetical protein
MTRRFTPPLPLQVRETCGAPQEVHYRGRWHTVTRLIESWSAPSAWWADSQSPRTLERNYYRIVLEGRLPCVVFCTGEGCWYLDRLLLAGSR